MPELNMPDYEIMEEQEKNLTLSMELDHPGRIFDIQRFSLHDGPGIRTIVFLKGCPLSCLWCSNPEGISYQRELMYFPNKCIGCQTCVNTCPKTALTFEEGTIRIERNKCDHCGQCAEACPSEALRISGKDLSVEEVIKEVEKDLVFYQVSGGGITVSGGEPMNQPEFVISLLLAAKKAGINTTLETCGYASTETFLQVLTQVDYLLYDIKHMNPEKHRKFTGKDNKIILENLKQAVKTVSGLRVRVPLIPGFNDSSKEVREIASFVSSLSITSLDILPYHRLGLSKYRSLGKFFGMDRIKPLERSRAEELKHNLEEKYLLKVRVGG